MKTCIRNTQKNNPHSDEFHPDIFIKTAKYISDYKIEITFCDDLVKVIDFLTIINSTRDISPIREFLDKKKFRNFKIRGRDKSVLSFGNGSIFEIFWEYLYNYPAPQKVKQKLHLTC